jgi:transcriptional regulator GlxA family with amidase domain
VRLEIFDVAGRRVLTRHLGFLEAGRHVTSTGGRADLPAGIYLVRMTLGSDMATAKVIVQR